MSADIIARGLAATVRQSTPQALPSRADLAAAPKNPAHAMLRETRRQGMFSWSAENHASRVAVDPAQALLVPEAGDDGSRGAWRRDVGPTAQIEWFGCVGDNVTNNTPALQQAVSTMAALYPEGFTLTAAVGAKFRLFGEVALPSGCRLFGIHLTNSGSANFLAINRQVAAADVFTSFFRNIRIEKCTFESDTANGAVACYAVNVRGLWFVDNHCREASGLHVRHGVEVRSLYSSSVGGSTTVDPAVLVGFSATDPDYALNEDVFFTGNYVDNTKPPRAAIRFNFCRRVVVANNNVRMSAISWWGGGAPASEGGMPDMLRRVRHVSITGNYIEGGNGGIYGNCGEHMAITGNVVKNVTDTGIDLEGCKHCVVTGNLVHNAGNFCMSVFYVGYNLLFAENLCIQDGTGTNISDNLYGGAAKIGTQQGNILFGFVSGSTNLASGIRVRIANNTFVWKGPATQYGRLAMGYGHHVEFNGNQYHNVTGNYDGANSFLPVIRNNTHYFDYALSDGSAADLVKVQSSLAAQAVCKGNTVIVDAAMPSGTRALYCEMSAFASTQMTVEDNEIRTGTNGSLPASGVGSSLVLLGNPSSVIFVASYRVRNNLVSDISDVSPPARARIFYEGNRNLAGQSVPTIETLPASGNYAKGSRFESSSPVANGRFARIALNDGATMPSTAVWASATDYPVGSSFWVNDNGTARIYQVTTAGKSDGATAPSGTGSAITNGTMIVRYMAPITSWGQQSLTSATATDSTTSASSLTPDIVSFGTFARSSQAVTLTVNAPTGTPQDGQTIRFRLKDNGTSRTLIWNSVYRPVGIILPSATTAGKTTYLTAIYNTADSKWDVCDLKAEA